MRRHLARFSRPTALLLTLIYLLGAVPACAHCFSLAAAMQAQPDNHMVGMAAAHCPCNPQVSSVHHALSAPAITAKVYHQPTPIAGAVVALLDVTASASARRSLSDLPQFRSPSRVLNYGVRLE